MSRDDPDKPLTWARILSPTEARQIELGVCDLADLDSGARLNVFGEIPPGDVRRRVQVVKRKFEPSWIQELPGSGRPGVGIAFVTGDEKTARKAYRMAARYLELGVQSVSLRDRAALEKLLRRRKDTGTLGVVADASMLIAAGEVCDRYSEGERGQHLVLAAMHAGGDVAGEPVDPVREGQSTSLLEAIEKTLPVSLLDVEIDGACKALYLSLSCDSKLGVRWEDGDHAVFSAAREVAKVLRREYAYTTEGMVTVQRDISTYVEGWWVEIGGGGKPRKAKVDKLRNRLQVGPCLADLMAGDMSGSQAFWGMGAGMHLFNLLCQGVPCAGIIDASGKGVNEGSAEGTV